MEISQLHTVVDVANEKKSSQNARISFFAAGNHFVE
jgi:hypothetical protein